MSPKEPQFKSGFVSIIGRPNVGKSTMMNSLVGQKVAIVSNKAQTTRNKIRGILSQESCQIIFIDTPGIHTPKNKLGNVMVKAARSSIGDSDIALHIVEPTPNIHPADAEIIEGLRRKASTAILVINKIDKVRKEELLGIIAAYSSEMDYAEHIPISAINGLGLSTLIEQILARLPEGPKFFHDDIITDQPERQVCAEIIREKLLHLLEDEIPHGIAVEITAFRPREDKDIIDIEANVVCERDSHKGMVIGKGGAVLKEAGKLARTDIEHLVGQQVFLRLWVKVRKGWRDSDAFIKSYGFREH